MRDGYELIRHIYKISKEDYEKRLDEFIEMLDMKEFINQPVRQLSLGQKMRAEIVATMLHNPKIIFLDEPTIGLDLVAKKKIQDFIRTINKKYNVSLQYLRGKGRAEKMKYLFFLKRALKNNTIYRFDYFLGCLNVCIQIFISCEIWKALYITNHVSGKVSLNVVLTSFIINLGLSNIYSIDDLTVQRKFCDGTIICELLKPINYRIYLLADTVGNILFKLLFNLIPCSARPIVEENTVISREDGFDSLGIVDFFVAVEEECGVDLEDSIVQIREASVIENLVDIIYGRILG